MVLLLLVTILLLKVMVVLMLLVLPVLMVVRPMSLRMPLLLRELLVRLTLELLMIESAAGHRGRFVPTCALALATIVKGLRFVRILHLRMAISHLLVDRVSRWRLKARAAPMRSRARSLTLYFLSLLSVCSCCSLKLGSRARPRGVNLCVIS